MFGISLLKLGLPLAFLFLSLYLFGITLGLFVSAGLLRFGPSFENIAWSTMFLLAPFGCIYYPVETLPEIFQSIAFALPLVYIFEETRNILVNGIVNYENIINAIYLNGFYLILSIYVFYYSGAPARSRTQNLLIRSQALYPVELQAHIILIYHFMEKKINLTVDKLSLIHI